MAAWTNATPAQARRHADRTPPTSSDAGIVRPSDGRRHFDLERFTPHPDLDRWVERYWTVRWALPSGTSYVSSVLTHPAVHLSFESGEGPRHGHPMPAALLHGVVTRRFDVTLTGEGRVFGVKFRPGGFGAFAGSDVRRWTDRVIALDQLLPVGDLLGRVLAESDDSARARIVDDWLLSLHPAADERYDQLLGVVADMLADRSLTTVQEVCARHRVGVRTLQRLFRAYVGVGPKWVLQRFRLHDAQAMLDTGWQGDLADLAAELGWFDQAHFAREFRDLVGMPPSEYAAATLAADPQR